MSAVGSSMVEALTLDMPLPALLIVEGDERRRKERQVRGACGLHRRGCLREKMRVSHPTGVPPDLRGASSDSASCARVNPWLLLYIYNLAPSPLRPHGRRTTAS
jgi:hypothetical protein